MNKPILAINYKAYDTAFGTKGLAIALIAEKIAKEYAGSIKIILAVPHTEIARISDAVEEAIVYAQHADAVPPGAYTGYTPLEAVKEAGAKGVLLNHSEHRLKLSEIDWLIKRSLQLKLETIVCADTPTAAAAIAILMPTMIAIEPPELIGTGIPVSRAKPEVVTETLKLVKQVNPEIPVLAGAGITSSEDVAAAIKLGTHGVLVASAIMKAVDPETKIREMVEAALEAWETRGKARLG